MKKIILLLTIISLCSCKAIHEKFHKNTDAQNISDIANDRLIAMKGYQPIDPIKINSEQKNDTIGIRNILKELPNEATRIAIGKLDMNGSISFGPFNIAKSGESYTIVVDYIKYITTSIPAKFSSEYSEDDIENIKKNMYLDALDYYDEQSPTEEMHPKMDSTEIGKKQIDKNIYFKTNHGEIKYKEIQKTESLKDFTYANASDQDIKIPVYVGVGLRIQASVTVIKDSLNLNLGSLYGLGVAASQNQLTGTLVIQTLGISGETISSTIPIPGRINESTIQSAMQSLGVIKSKIYDTKTDIVPQVVAFGLPFSVKGAKDLIETSLHKTPPTVIINEKGAISFREIEWND